MKGECPSPKPNCPYGGDCFSDLHHVYYPSIDYRDIIEREFRVLPENKEQKCRWEHEQRHAQEPPDKPPKEYMLGRIATALANCEINLSKNKLRKLKLM